MLHPVTTGGNSLFAVMPTKHLMNLRAVCRGCHAAITANFRKTGVNEPPAKPVKPWEAAEGRPILTYGAKPIVVSELSRHLTDHLQRDFASSGNESGPGSAP